MRHRTLTWRGRALPIEGAPLGPGRGISIVSSTGRPMNGELYDGDRYLGVVFAWQAHAVLLPGDYGQQMPMRDWTISYMPPAESQVAA